MCNICMPPEYRRNAAINRLARERAQSLPAGELLGGAGEPFTEDEILDEIQNGVEFLKDCG